MISKKLLIPMAVVAVIGAGVYSVSRVSAASDPSDPQASLVQKIADTFHLDKSKVQAVFDQNRADNQQQREAAYEQRLTQAVTGGKLTSAQKDAILAEHNKLASEMTTAMAKTGTDRLTAMDQIRTEGQAWAAQNNIDQTWLMGSGRPHLRGGMGTMDDGATPSPSPSPAS
jgi:hypothetical protein